MKKNVWEKTDDVYSLSIRVQTMHVKPHFDLIFTTIARSKKINLSLMLKKPVTSSLQGLPRENKMFPTPWEIELGCFLIKSLPLHPPISPVNSPSPPHHHQNPSSPREILIYLTDAMFSTLYKENYKECLG